MPTGASLPTRARCALLGRMLLRYQVCCLPRQGCDCCHGRLGSAQAPSTKARTRITLLSAAQ
eukprot:10292150-Prorocentrum_lima.AAC.1